MENITSNAAQQLHEQLGVSQRYPLLVPIALKDGTQLTQLTLRRPTAKEMRFVPLTGKLDLGVILTIVGSMCNLHPDEVDMIDGADCFEIAGIIAPFLERGPGATA